MSILDFEHDRRRYVLDFQKGTVSEDCVLASREYMHGWSRVGSGYASCESGRGFYRNGRAFLRAVLMEYERWLRNPMGRPLDDFARGRLDAARSAFGR